MAQLSALGDRHEQNSPMKKCSYCGAEYPDDAVMCAIDHTPFEIPAGPPPPEPKRPEYHFPPLSAADMQKDFVTLVRCGTLVKADMIVIRKLPAPVEFCLVLFVCFWWAIYASIVAISNHSKSTTSLVQQPFTGIGVELGAKDDKVIIMQVVANTPASKAGLSYGLVIQKIDGATTDGKSLKDCGDMVRGPAGSNVKLELVDMTDNKTNTVELTRETIQGAIPKIPVTDRSTLRVAIFELFGLAVTFWIARTRGWPLGAWGFRPSWKLTGAGVLLCLITVLVLSAIVALSNIISPGAVHGHLASHMTLPVLVLFVAVNPFFEEAMEVGYFVQSLQRYGMWGTVLASAFFRAFLHAYQDITALVIIFPLGLIFGFVYWKWRRLWPLYIAHVLFDLYAMYPR
jgi:membrane protease YdiL (CAAX protease family)